VAGVGHRRERQDLQRHPPAQADLLGLVHHPIPPRPTSRMIR
jgi:hypothetical protein